LLLPPLTKRQLQILEFYRSYTRTHGLSPTLEEVARHFGVNKVTIFGHVSELERKGVLTKSAAKKSRARQIAPGAEESAVRDLRIPILGRIAAGSPIEAVEDPEELELAELIPRDREVFALRVRGQSMIEDGIHDGDLVIVESRNHASDGEMVVAILPGEEATLKRLHREGDLFRLQPANSTMQPILTRELEIRGVVIGVVRKY
jgi:repressor LexA